jgi:hypothetical protein
MSRKSTGYSRCRLRAEPAQDRITQRFFSLLHPEGFNSCSYRLGRIGICLTEFSKLPDRE